ncbi:hypothetical protein HZA39_02430 [Candidatus Peregrinibacteria bacterium]|nr:hypothetical protein [Candidatus Peregrinibacteria bacterium]
MENANRQELLPENYKEMLIQRLLKNPRLMKFLTLIIFMLAGGGAKNAMAQTQSTDNFLSIPNASKSLTIGQKGGVYTLGCIEECDTVEPSASEGLTVKKVEAGANFVRIKITPKKNAQGSQFIQIGEQKIKVNIAKPTEPLATQKSLEETKSGLEEELKELKLSIENAPTQEDLKKYIQTTDLPSDFKEKLTKIIDNPASQSDLNKLKEELIGEINKSEARIMEILKKYYVEKDASTKHSIGLFFEKGLAGNSVAGGYAEYGYNIEEWLALTASLGGSKEIRPVKGFSGEKTDVIIGAGTLGIRFDINLIRDNLKFIFGGKFLAELENAESRTLPDGYHVKAGSKTNFGGNVFGGFEAGLKNIGFRAGVSAEFKKGQKEVLGDKEGQLQPRIFLGVNGKF